MKDLLKHNYTNTDLPSHQRKKSQISLNSNPTNKSFPVDTVKDLPIIIEKDEEMDEKAKLIEQINADNNKVEYETKTVYQEGNMVLINPKYDCSEKQLFIRNGLKNPNRNLIRWMKNDDKITYKLDNKIMVP